MMGKIIILLLLLPMISLGQKRDDEITPIHYDSLFTADPASYVSQFEAEFGVHFDFDKNEDIMKLDKIITDSKNKKALQNLWEKQMVAIVGTYIIRNKPESTWSLLKIDSKRTSCIIIDSKRFVPYDPYSIIMNRFDKKKIQMSLKDRLILELKNGD